MVGRLGVSRTTVRTHLQAVLTKLGVHSRLEAASFAVHHRLPELWAAGEGRQAAEPAVRPAAAGVPTTRAASAPAARASGPVRPIRPRQVADLGAEAVPKPLSAVAVQGASAS